MSFLVGRRISRSILGTSCPTVGLFQCWNKLISSTPILKGETGFSGEKKNVIFNHMERVSSFGGVLSAKTPFDINVTPLIPNEHPNLDRAFVNIFSKSNKALKEDDVKVNIDKQDQNLEVTVNNNSVKNLEDVKQEIKIPIVHSLKIRVEGNANIEAEDFIESDYCDLKTESGEINVYNIKTCKLALKSKTGDILCRGNIQGDIVIDSKDGNVIGDKRLSGPSLEIATHSGDIRIASCYSESSKFSTDTGSMHLRNIHNEAYIAIYEKGNLTLNGMDGAANIFVKNGDVSCHISRIRAESRIHVEDGDIIVKISDNFPIKIDIEGNDVIPDVNFRNKGKIEEKEDSKTFSCSLQPEKFSPHIYIVAENGTVVLESQDWAASLGLKMPVEFDKSGKLS